MDHMLSLRQRSAGVVAALATLAVAAPVAGASAQLPAMPLPTLAAPPTLTIPNNLCPTIPGFLNFGPTGPLGPLGAYGPTGSANNVPTGCAAWNLGPSGPLGPHGVLNPGG
jgi:hypothetical protein